MGIGNPPLRMAEGDQPVAGKSGNASGYPKWALFLARLMRL